MGRSNGTILVTGAAGFVGSTSPLRLAAMGHQRGRLRQLQRLLRPAHSSRTASRPCWRPARRRRASTVELADGGQAAPVRARPSRPLVVHLAAQAGVRYSLQNPAAYVQANLVGFRQHAGSLPPARACSTCCMPAAAASTAPTPRRRSRKTTRPTHPVSLYAATKKANELMAHTYSHLYGMPDHGPALLHGVRAVGPAGHGATSVSPRKMLAGETIPVFAEGKLRRDFTYIDDIVEGVVRLLFKPTAGSEAAQPPHAVFNIGNSQPVQVLDFIRTLEDALGVQGRSWTSSRCSRATCRPRMRTRAGCKRWVGYKPTTPLATGLREFARVV